MLRFLVGVLCLAACSAVPVVIEEHTIGTVSVGAPGQVVNVTWERQNDGTFIDRVALFLRSQPCEQLEHVIFESQQTTGTAEIQIPTTLSAADRYTIHVFKNSNETSLTSACAWTDLAALSVGSADLAVSSQSAAVFTGTFDDAFTWVGTDVKAHVCNISKAFSLEMWMRCAGSCDEQIILDSSTDCGFRIRILSALQMSFGMTAVPDLLEASAHYSRNAYTYVPDRIPALQLEIFDASRTVVYNVSVPTVVADAKWHHVAVTRGDNGTTRLIVDGTPSRDHNTSSGLDWQSFIGASESDTAFVSLGGPILGSSDNSSFFTGNVAGVRVWDAPLRVQNIVDALRAHASFNESESFLAQGYATVQAPHVLGSWPLTSVAKTLDTSGQASRLTQQIAHQFLPTSIGPWATFEAHMSPDALKITCETKASEAIFIREPNGLTGTYFVQCPATLCNASGLDDLAVQDALTLKRRKLPLATPICYGALSTSILSPSNIATEPTILKLSYGYGTVNFTGTVASQEYVQITVPPLVRGFATSRLVEANDAVDSVVVNVSMGHQPLCEGLLNEETGICYNFTGTMMTWVDAWDHCANWGGTPAIVRSAQDFLWIRSQFSMYVCGSRSILLLAVNCIVRQLFADLISFACCYSMPVIICPTWLGLEGLA